MWPYLIAVAIGAGCGVVLFFALVVSMIFYRPNNRRRLV